MLYKIPDHVLEELSTLVPTWVINEIKDDKSEDDIREKLKAELASAHQIAGRPISTSELDEKAEDLLATYLEVLREYRINN